MASSESVVLIQTIFNIIGQKNWPNIWIDPSDFQPDFYANLSQENVIISQISDRKSKFLEPGSIFVGKKWHEIELAPFELTN